MRPARRLAAWTMPRSVLVADLLTMAAERDRWERTAKEARRIADEAVAVAHRYADELEAEQARNAALIEDWDRMVAR